MNEIESQKSNVYEVNWDEYKAALAKCKDCVFLWECRGPTPVDLKCPQGRDFYPVAEAFHPLSEFFK